MYESVFRLSHTAISFHSCFLQPCILPNMFLWSVKFCSTKWNQKCWTSQRIWHFLTYIWIHVNRTHLFRKTSCFFFIKSHLSRVLFVAAVVEDFPPDLRQPTNLLVTLLTYSSIAVQNTKGIQCTMLFLQGVGQCNFIVLVFSFVLVYWFCKETSH